MQNETTSHVAFSFPVLGGVAAVSCSWYLNHNVGWAILHFFCSWLYVVYALLARSPILSHIFGAQ